MTRDEMDEIKRHFESATAETRRHFDVVAEGLTAQITVIAEGHALLNEKAELGRKDLAALLSNAERLGLDLGAHRSEVHHEFTELRAMMKLSYAELEGRVTRLEGALAEVVGRLERLERARLA